MKKIIGILLTMVVLFMVLCATADEVSQPEGGKKFENDWAVEGGIAEIYYEEEGYRVYIKIDKPDALAGSEYEYSCYYHEDTDSLVSISSVRSDYTISPDTGEEIYAEDAVVYEGIDEEEKGTEFIIDEDGFLIWNDGHDNAGDSLKFRNIGRFEGVWRNEEAGAEADFMFNGAEEGIYDYTVYYTRGKTDAESYTLYLMTGEYDPMTGKLAAGGTGTVFTKNADGEYDAADSDLYVEIVFSVSEEGKLLNEIDHIVFEYDLLGNVG